MNADKDDLLNKAPDSAVADDAQEQSIASEASDASDEAFDAFGKQFETALLAMQTQNLPLAQETHLTVQNQFRHLSAELAGDDLRMVRVMTNHVELIKDLLTVFALGTEGRQQKALEVLNSMLLKMEESKTELSGVQDQAIREDELFQVFEALTEFFQRIITASVILAKAAIDIESDKIVDQTVSLSAAIKEYRKINEYTWPSDNELFPMLSGMLNRLADMTERRLEKTISDSKLIKFVTPTERNVFIVHGHDHGILRELKEMLTVSFGIEPIILLEKPDSGGTLIEKFEHYGNKSAFAFVIFTHDDLVRKKGVTVFQGRPDVIFELGWFYGRFGRNRVRILKQKDTTLPSDLNGILTIEFAERLEEVFRKIKSDLEQSGVLERLPESD